MTIKERNTTNAIYHALHLDAEPTYYDGGAIRQLVEHLESKYETFTTMLADTVCGYGSFVIEADGVLYVVREYYATTWTCKYTVDVLPEWTEELWAEACAFADSDCDE